MDSNKTTLTKQEALSLFNGLQEVTHFPGTYWSYAIAKNISALTPEIHALQEAYTASEDFVKYEYEREELAKKYAIKDGDSYKTTTVNGIEEYEIKDRNGFDKEYQKLRRSHDKAIRNREKQLKDFKDILSENIEISLTRLAPEHIPQHITPSQLSSILPIIRDENIKVDKSKSN